MRCSDDGLDFGTRQLIDYPLLISLCWHGQNSLTAVQQSRLVDCQYLNKERMAEGRVLRLRAPFPCVRSMSIKNTPTSSASMSATFNSVGGFLTVAAACLGSRRKHIPADN